MKYLNKSLIKCYNMILIKDIIQNKYKKKYINLKMNFNLNKNLIFQKELYQEKDLLEL